MLFLEFGDVMLQKLVNQKPQMVQKLTVESKREAANSKQAEDTATMTSSSFGMKEEGKSQSDQ